MALAFPWKLGEHSLVVTTCGVLGRHVGTCSQSGVVMGWRPRRAAAGGLAHGLQLSSELPQIPQIAWSRALCSYVSFPPVRKAGPAPAMRLLSCCGLHRFSCVPAPLSSCPCSSRAVCSQAPAFPPGADFSFCHRPVVDRLGCCNG